MKPDLVFAYEQPLVLVRPDGHVAWRGSRLPNDLADLLKTACGDKEPRNVPQPEVGFGQKNLFLDLPTRKATTL